MPKNTKSERTEKKDTPIGETIKGAFEKALRSITGQTVIPGARAKRQLDQVNEKIKRAFE